MAAGGSPKAGAGVAIITQSSNIACNLTMQQRGLPIAFLLTAGNQAQTGLSEMALGLVEDPPRFRVSACISRASTPRPASSGWRRAPGSSASRSSP